MQTLNQIVKTSGISRYKIEKYVESLEIEPEIQVRGKVSCQRFTDDQVDRILAYAATQKAVKEDTSVPIPAPTTLQLPTSIIEQELSAAKAQVQLLLDERNYLRAALEKEQSNTKTMAEQLATQDQRTATIIAALSQPKELAEKTAEKRGFWQRLFM
jgi:septal ring factor EnvC (AmiA/AmiB activator)